METVDNTRHLDPPDDTPEYSDCDGCGVTCHTQDLTKTGTPGDYRYLCSICLDADGEQ